MHTFKYVGDDERAVQTGPTTVATVQPGDTFEVDDERAAGLEGQELFELAKPQPAKGSDKPKGD